MFKFLLDLEKRKEKFPWGVNFAWTFGGRKPTFFFVFSNSTSIGHHKGSPLQECPSLCMFLSSLVSGHSLRLGMSGWSSLALLVGNQSNDWWWMIDVSGLSLDCLLTVSRLSLDCLWTVPGVSLDCLWTVSRLSLDCLWTVSGLSLDCRTVSGLSLDCLWTVCRQ